MEEAKVIENAKLWDFSGFWKIYDMYIDSIYKFIYLKTSSKEVAEDITSDVFMSALNKIDSFNIEANSSIKSWLYRIANNKVIDFYRTNKTTEEIWDYLDMSIKEDISGDIDNKEKLKEIVKFLDTLKKDQREIITLRIWEDLSYREISEITGKSIDNCKKIVSRSLKLISANFVLLLLLIIIL